MSTEDKHLTQAEQKVRFIDKSFLSEGKDVVLFDIDGTLAHMVDRGPYEWEKVGSDEVDKTIQRIFRMHRIHGDFIICMSGRDELCRPQTEEWLIRHHVFPDALFMRPKRDNRKDSIVKKEIYDNFIKDKYNVLMIYDDRNQVVEMWRSLGLKCLQVADGNF